MQWNCGAAWRYAVVLLACAMQMVSVQAFAAQRTTAQTVAAAQPFDPAFLGPPTLWPAADPASGSFIGPTLVEPFPLLDSQVLPGKLARLEWKGSQSFSGGEVVSPVVVLHGVRPGPVLCLTAGVHGDELNGVEIVRQITRIVDPADLGGTIVAVPIVNLFGFSRNSRYLPDRRDLNRFFPGTRYGSIASRIAHGFFTQVMTHCDALVDFHTGSFDRSNLPQVRADLRTPEVREFTRGFGATTVLHSPGTRGMLRYAATLAGIPAVTFEVGGPGELQAAEIAFGVQAIQTLLHKLGMTRHLPEWDATQPIFYDSQWVRADAGGLLLSRVELGDAVERGQVLGVVIDPINDIERELVSPVKGHVLGKARNQVVLPGFAAFHVGEETSEQRAVREAQTGAVPVVGDEGRSDADEPSEDEPLDEELD